MGGRVNAGKGGTSGNLLEDRKRKTYILPAKKQRRSKDKRKNFHEVLLEVRLPTRLEGPESVNVFFKSTQPPVPHGWGGDVIMNSFTVGQAAN